MRLVLNQVQLQKVLASPDGAVARNLAKRAQRVRDQAVVNASGRPGPNVQTNRLRSSIRWQMGLDTKGIHVDIGTPVEYAKYVELGTGPHVIRPVRKKALFWPGAEHPVAWVLHPGNKAYPFLGPALAAGGGAE